MIDFLPTVNAILNASSAVLLVNGFIQIRRQNREWHKRSMIAAIAVSILFLVSYLTYHARHGTTQFLGEGWVRPFYFVILTTHTILAVAIVPMVIVTLRRGLAGTFEKHVRIARFTLPLWLYVSVTGVVVYIMLYHLFPHS